MEEKNEAGQQKLYYDPLSVSRRTIQKNHFVEDHDKLNLLNYLIKENNYVKTIVMVKTKKIADSVTAFLEGNEIKVLALHANKSKVERDDAVKLFNEEVCDVLITTDMILQSYDFLSIKHMISYNLPLEVQQYYARLASMQEKGEGISLVSEEDQHIIAALEWAMKLEIPEAQAEGFVTTPTPEAIQTGIKDRTKKPRHKKSKSDKKNKSE